jgi:cell division protein YceG involved in septum cleavage
MALALILCIGLLFLMWQILVPTNSEEKILRIRSGDTAQTIATKLSELGLIRSEYLFVQLAKLTKNDRQLQTGTYVIGGHLNLWQVVNNLKDGKQENIRLTFQEGLSLFRSASGSRIAESNPASNNGSGG